jgi:23S rRNA (guanosine2251-2'-O)-methyltransferase
MVHRRGSSNSLPPAAPEEVFPPHSGTRRHRRGERVPTAAEQLSESRPAAPGQMALTFDTPGEGAAEVPMEEGRILLGPHAVGEALRAGRRPVQVVFLSATERGERFREVGRLARARGVTVRQADPQLIETLAAGRVHQGIAALAGEYPYLDLRELETVAAERGRDALFVALDQVQDPQNLGAVLRSSVAFGADVVVLPERRAAGVTEAVVRASAGATELMRIARVPNLSEALRRLAAAGLELVGFDTAGEVDLHLADLRPPLCVVLGAEGPGLRRLTRELCHRRVRIPIAVGGVASLNVSVAAGIVLHAIRNPAPPAGERHGR